MRSIGGSEVKRNILVDGNNLIYRAYYAFVEKRLKEGKPVLCSPNGFPTGVIYGFLSMLSSWIHDISSPTSISIFFDGVPSRRLSLNPEYKAGREGIRLNVAKSIELQDGRKIHGEIELLTIILRLLGCDIYHNPKEEADDLIASYIQSKPNEIHVIISADKDFFQLLINPRVVCYIPGVDGNRFFDAERSGQYWAKLNKGNHPVVPPTHVRMFKALCGDSSDSIQGVERLRKKVAVHLCHHTSVDDLYSTGFPGFSITEKEKTISARNRIHINYDLVGLNGEIELLECFRSGSTDIASAKDICRENLGMKSMDFSVFNLRHHPPVPVPVEHWLLDI